MESGKLSLAFTRFVDGYVKINEYEREKDRHMTKKRCSDFEKIAELLAKDGVMLKKEMVKEPEDIEIRYEITGSKIENQLNNHPDMK